MFQRSQLGKRPTKKERIELMLKNVYVTPSGDRYKLIEYRKQNGGYLYIYEWINCPKEILNKTNNRIQSKSELQLIDIINWIDELKDL